MKRIRREDDEIHPNVTESFSYLKSQKQIYSLYIASTCKAMKTFLVPMDGRKSIKQSSGVVQIQRGKGTVKIK